jgi:molybdopterin-guanine dinucleotide biosynthesis protein A
MGGAKATRALCGRPLLAFPADALAEHCERLAVVCKPGTGPPADGDWEVWDDEPPEPRHPAIGIVHALARAERPVLVCAADMPFVTAAECAALLEAAAAQAGGAVAIVAAGDGRLEPLLGAYAPEAAPVLRAAASRGDPVRAAVEGLDPVRVDLPSAALRSVNTPAELAAAERELCGG